MTLHLTGDKGRLEPFHKVSLRVLGFLFHCKEKGLACRKMSSQILTFPKAAGLIIHSHLELFVTISCSRIKSTINFKYEQDVIMKNFFLYMTDQYEYISTLKIFLNYPFLNALHKYSHRIGFLKINAIHKAKNETVLNKCV